MPKGFPKIRARCVGDDAWIDISGREAETLIQLIEKGSVGLRAYDFPGGPPFRLSAYVHDLRGFGFPVRTEREIHEGGFHAVYHLDATVEIEVACARSASDDIAA